MTAKEQHIIEYLKNHNGAGFYIDIRNELGMEFDDEVDFDSTLELLKRKNWLYENKPGDTKYLLNSEMIKSKPFEAELTDYKVLSNGADGGHHYISTEIEYEGEKRKIIVLFLEKSDEKKLTSNHKIKVSGDLIDEGKEYSFMLLNTTIKK
ncbi:hypothetical protein QYS49_39580 [Marivirga salinae]|uniref:Uncharacterized protein n=1 Tax=Marivirga salinarum TaxID=3059078 RepID=A0AA51REJ1_9BACT|nr:hypothetical protein [Marivirga sp. BDSF4-3]WMN11775.1 hypothetical protein QYS49_39580 [Marivirga sp. BDSF4-3]